MPKAPRAGICKMPCYSIDGVLPVVEDGAYVHPTAVLIGDVRVAPGCYVGPNASLRGDFGSIELRAGANVQDACVVHGFPGKATIVEENGHVGHGAILHGCVVGKDALVGMNAVVMDEAVVGELSFIGASAFVPAGMVIPARSLVIGVPARVVRLLSDEEIAWKRIGTGNYHDLVKRSLDSMVEVEPLREMADRKAVLSAPEGQSLVAMKRPNPSN